MRGLFSFAAAASIALLLIGCETQEKNAGVIVTQTPAAPANPPPPCESNCGGSGGTGGSGGSGGSGENGGGETSDKPVYQISAANKAAPPETPAVYGRSTNRVISGN